MRYQKGYRSKNIPGKLPGYHHFLKREQGVILIIEIVNFTFLHRNMIEDMVKEGILV